MVPIWKARRIRGKRRLQFQFEERFLEYLQSFKEGTDLEVIVRRASKKRTLPQNRYYFGVVVRQLAKFCGYDEKRMHQSLKNEFLSYRDEETGLLVTLSTAELSTVAFRKYCDEVQRWAAEFLGFVIPDPPSAIDWSSNEMEM